MASTRHFTGTSQWYHIIPLPSHPTIPIQLLSRKCVSIVRRVLILASRVEPEGTWVNIDVIRVEINAHPELYRNWVNEKVRDDARREADGSVVDNILTHYMYFQGKCGGAFGVNVNGRTFIYNCRR